MRLALVQNPNNKLVRHFARMLLIELAEDKDVEVRLAVAHNPNLRAALMVLSHDEEPRVRSAVARNPTTSEPFLWKLSQDPDAGVRKAAAENPKTAAALKNAAQMETEYLEYQRRTRRAPRKK